MRTHNSYFQRSQDQFTHFVSKIRTQKGGEIFTIRLCETMPPAAASSTSVMGGQNRPRRAPEFQADLFFEIWDFVDTP